MYYPIIRKDAPMAKQETQEQVNDREWRNLGNWSGTKWFGVYFCKLDSRLFVPKRSFPGLGWTINLGHPAGPRLFYSVTLLLPFLIMAISFLIFLGLFVGLTSNCSSSHITNTTEKARIQSQQNS
jgi:hypothetical protein